MLMIPVMGDDFNLWMEQAIREAEKGSDKGEVPVGAVLVGADGTVVERPIISRSPSKIPLPMRRFWSLERQEHSTGTTGFPARPLW